MRPRNSTALLLTVFLCAAALQVYGGLEPPRALETTDSTSIRTEKGIEFVRTTEQSGISRFVTGKFSVDVNGRWKTDWQLPEHGDRRIRQEGRWYVGLRRTILPALDAWLAATGEHLDDRPYGSPRPTSGSQTADSGASAVFIPAQSTTAVRILRGGGGLTLNAWKPLTINAAVGPVQDRRISQVHSGLGVWSKAEINHWNLAGYDQSLDLEYGRETPRNHNSEDLSGRYELYREFYAGNTNRTQISGSSLGRDVFFDATGEVARRRERRFEVRDALTYGVTKAVKVQFSGELTHQKTEQSQQNSTVSSLEENQVGFESAIEARQGRLDSELQMAIRTITQTVRGDILQGHKTDLALQSRADLPGNSKAALRLSVSKYSLDTRNPDNYDDRDQIQYAAEALWSRPFFHTMVYEIFGVARLDHLVYIYSKSSANNRWTRFLLLGSNIRHRPSPGFNHTVRLTVSANYQDFDFDADPRTSRSTVHRRVVVSDSANATLAPRWRLESKLSLQQEEFGRLFWSSFTEERSDETYSVSASLQVVHRVLKDTDIGAGALWDSRKGERFPTSTQSKREVFQNLRTYGPQIMLTRSVPRGFYLDLRARSLRQYQLNRDPRWILMGEMTGGLRW
jgi:hypothetical protein